MIDGYLDLRSLKLHETLSERELQIMESALEIFADKGYASASTREIAKKAGIAEGTIFRYFKTKKEIFLRLISTLFYNLILPSLQQQVEAILQEHKDKPLEEVFLLIIYNNLTLVKANSRYLKLFFSEIQFHEEFKDKFFTELILQVTELISIFLEEKQQQGLIRPGINCQMTVYSLIGMTVTFVMWQDFFNGHNKFLPTDEEIATHITRIILNGIKAN